MNFISVRGQIVLVDIMALFNYISLYSQVELLHDICEVHMGYETVVILFVQLDV